MSQKYPLSRSVTTASQLQLVHRAVLSIFDWPANIGTACLDWLLRGLDFALIGRSYDSQSPAKSRTEGRREEEVLLKNDNIGKESALHLVTSELREKEKRWAESKICCSVPLNRGFVLLSASPVFLAACLHGRSALIRVQFGGSAQSYCGDVNDIRHIYQCNTRL